MSSPGEPANPELPAVDERLVAPESRYEIDDGKLVYVAPADPPHAISHGALGAVLRAHCHPGFTVALDMLTRTSRTSDIAPDASVFPSAPDPRTGGRQLEVLAFEIVSTESIGHAAHKAAMLAARGVRRTFGLDVVRRRAFEWSPALADWSMLATEGQLEDPALAVPVPIAALVDAARADDATVKAFRTRRHPEFLAEREQGIEQGIERGIEQGVEQGRALALRAVLRKQLVIRFGPLAPADDARIEAAMLPQLERYLERVVTAAALAEVLAP